VRKFAELFAAHELENLYTKDEILELYINTIYYGSGYTGIEAAARGYFGVGAAYLTPVQCTLLAGLPQAPSRYSPDNDPALTLQRQASVVERLRRDGILTDREAAHLLDTAPMALHRWLEAPAA
jgi:membrane peptidoglycan carboxypeptidase